MLKNKAIYIVLTIVLIANQSVMVSAVERKEVPSYFGTFSGVVQEIHPHGVNETMELVLVKNEEGAIANLVISDSTYFIGEGPIQTGQKIKGYYVADAPMLMIYPPQYSTKVVIIGEGEMQIKVDRFDEELISDDNRLKLNDLSETKITDEGGNAYTKVLDNRQLIVYYDKSTRSIPAQTNPNKIIVLDRELPINEMEIVVDGAVIEAPQAFENEEGIIMVPMRAISEALGFEVEWNNETRTVLVGTHTSFEIGINQYTYGKMIPVKLSHEPLIKNDHSFIPLNYFTDVLQVQDAYVGEYEIFLNNPMNLRD